MKKELLILLVFTIMLASCGLENPLNDLTGDIIVESNEGARVWINNNNVGVVGASGELLVQNIRAGTHTLRARLDGYEDIVKQVIVVPQETTRVEMRFYSQDSCTITAGFGCRQVGLEVIENKIIKAKLELQNLMGRPINIKNVELQHESLGCKLQLESRYVGNLNNAERVYLELMNECESYQRGVMNNAFTMRVTYNFADVFDDNRIDMIMEGRVVYVAHAVEYLGENQMMVCTGVECDYVNDNHAPILILHEDKIGRVYYRNNDGAFSMYPLRYLGRNHEGFTLSLFGDTKTIQYGKTTKYYMYDEVGLEVTGLLALAQDYSDFRVAFSLAESSSGENKCTTEAGFSCINPNVKFFGDSIAEISFEITNGLGRPIRIEDVILKTRGYVCEARVPIFYDMLRNGDNFRLTLPNGGSAYLGVVTDCMVNQDGGIYDIIVNYRYADLPEDSGLIMGALGELIVKKVEHLPLDLSEHDLIVCVEGESCMGERTYLVNGKRTKFYYKNPVPYSTTFMGITNERLGIGSSNTEAVSILKGDIGFIRDKGLDRNYAYAIHYEQFKYSSIGENGAIISYIGRDFNTPNGCKMTDNSKGCVNVIVPKEEGLEILMVFEVPAGKDYKYNGLRLGQGDCIMGRELTGTMPVGQLVIPEDTLVEPGATLEGGSSYVIQYYCPGAHHEGWGFRQVFYLEYEDISSGLSNLKQSFSVVRNPN